MAKENEESSKGRKDINDKDMNQKDKNKQKFDEQTKGSLERIRYSSKVDRKISKN